MHRDYLNPLRPYPEDPWQDLVVQKTCSAASVSKTLLSKVSRAIKSPFHALRKLAQKAKSLRGKGSYGEKEGPLKAASAIEPVFVSACDRAMDAKFYYAVKEGKIWFKPIAAHPDAPWKLFGGSGEVDKAKTAIVSLCADGDNLIAIDERRRVHYAKTNRILVSVSFDAPAWRIEKESVSWTIQWFRMYIAARFVNRLKNPVLDVSSMRSVAISHKGEDALYYTDMRGKKHPDPLIGVTTLYALSAQGNRILFADPWLPTHFNNEITGPAEGTFIAENIAASASTLFLAQRARDEKGQEINKFFTRYADFDSIGCNPLLPATYNPGNRFPLVRYLPGEDWLEQPSIALEGKARLTKNIAVLTVGRGQNHRQLRVEGTNSEGKTGYYYKNVYEKEWAFEETSHFLAEEAFLSEESPREGILYTAPIVENYKGRLCSKWKDAPSEAKLEGFSRKGLNERGLHAKLILRWEGGQEILCLLHARTGFKHFLGFTSGTIKWQLTIPDEYRERAKADPQMAQALKRLFNNKKSLAVRVEEGVDQVVIKPEFFSSNRFVLAFDERIKESL